MGLSYAIAKACGGEPLRRVVTGEGHRVIYLMNPRIYNSQITEAFSGVGFPKDSVFKDDRPLFDLLCAAYASGDTEELARLWGTAIYLTGLE